MYWPFFVDELVLYGKLNAEMIIQSAVQVKLWNTVKEKLYPKEKSKECNGNKKEKF